ncbi:MAG: DUF167 domain-containing protein [bacterium]
MVDRAHTIPTIRPAARGLLVGVRVGPAASRTAVQGVYGDRLKVSVGAPPAGGRANRELTEVLAGWLGVRRDGVRVEAGYGSRDKVVAITGMDEAELRSKLTGLLYGGLGNGGD